MYGRLKGRDVNRAIKDPNRIKVLAVFQDGSIKRYVVEANWDTATHPKTYIHRDNYKIIYYDNKLDDMLIGFYWMLEHEFELYDITTNKAAKSLLTEEY